MKIKRDIIDYLKEYIEDSAENHIESYKDRYFGYTLLNLKFDLENEYDFTCELELAEDTLERKLTDMEKTFITNNFIREILKQYKNWRNK